MQTWVLRSEGRTILVDTGIGDSKERPGDPVLHHRKSDFLANLAAVGVHPRTSTWWSARTCTVTTWVNTRWWTASGYPPSATPAT